MQVSSDLKIGLESIFINNHILHILELFTSKNVMEVCFRIHHCNNDDTCPDLIYEEVLVFPETNRKLFSEFSSL